MQTFERTSSAVNLGPPEENLQTHFGLLMQIHHPASTSRRTDRKGYKCVNGSICRISSSKRWTGTGCCCRSVRSSATCCRSSFSLLPVTWIFSRASALSSVSSSGCSRHHSVRSPASCSLLSFSSSSSTCAPQTFSVQVKPGTCSGDGESVLTARLLACCRRARAGVSGSPMSTVRRRRSASASHSSRESRVSWNSCVRTMNRTGSTAGYWCYWCAGGRLT